MADDIEGTVTVTLIEPIVLKGTDGNEIERRESLTFRKPTALDIIEVGGSPVKIDMNDPNPAATIDFHGQRMGAMMARLAAVPPSIIARMSSNDWLACAWSLSDFFLPVRRTALSEPA